MEAVWANKVSDDIFVTSAFSENKFVDTKEFVVILDECRLLAYKLAADAFNADKFPALIVVAANLEVVAFVNKELVATNDEIVAVFEYKLDVVIDVDAKLDIVPVVYLIF
jgi:hypothetical protein